MRTIQMQILLPHLIAIPDDEHEVYAAKHIRKIQLSHPTKQNQKEIETWSPKQLAIMLHVSTQRIYEAIKDGQLTVQKIGAGYAIHQESVEKFLKTGNPFARRSDVDKVQIT